MTTRAPAPTVLVIEDDGHVVALLHDLLDLEGYRVETARDGLAGLVKLRTTPVDAVLLDVMMPDVDGNRLLDQLREEHAGALPVPVLVITGSPDAARRCREQLDPADVFDKPFDPTALLARLADRLDPQEPA